MSSSKTVLKTLRIKNEVAEYFKDKPLNRYIESLYEEIQSGEIEESGENLYVHTSGGTRVSQKKEEDKECAHSMNEDVLHEIESMCSFMGLGVEDFLLKVCEGLNTGEVWYENGRFKGITEIDVRKFVEACHEVNKDAQTMIDKCALMVERSSI